MLNFNVDTNLNVTCEQTLKAHSHDVICDCDLVLLTIGCIGAAEVVTINRSRYQKKSTV